MIKKRTILLEREREKYEKLEKKNKNNVLKRRKVLIRKRTIYMYIYKIKKTSVKIALAGIRTHIVLCKKPHSYPLRYGFFLFFTIEFILINPLPNYEKYLISLLVWME